MRNLKFEDRPDLRRRGTRCIKLKVSNHPWRCIDEEGTRCPHLRVARFGTTYTCKIFQEQTDGGKWPDLPERDGCLARLPECLEAEKEDRWLDD